MPNAPLNGAFLDTIGVEFEGVGIFARTLSEKLRDIIARDSGGNYPFQVTRDASVESMALPIVIGDSRHYVYEHNQFTRKIRSNRLGDSLAMGYEVVVEPSTVEDFEMYTTLILTAIQNCGDITSQRAATHFHVGYANNLRLLKNLLRICLWLDPLFFRLGGMGRRYRGFSNNSAYARPLLHPVCVPVGQDWSEEESPRRARLRTQSPTSRRSTEEYVEVMNVQVALEATTLEQFWQAFGVFPSRLGISKYHPTRYSSFNFYALAVHNTIECRHFNQSFNAPLVIAAGKLFRAAVELASLLGKHEVFDFPPGDSLREITIEEAATVMSTLRRWFSEKEVDNPPTEDEYELLMRTISDSSFTDLSDKPQLSHNRQFSLPRNLAEGAGLRFITNPEMPSQVDIHTIRNRDMAEDYEG